MCGSIHLLVFAQAALEHVIITTQAYVVRMLKIRFGVRLAAKP